MQYKDFVREMFDKHRGKMAAKDIMKLAAKEWPSVRDGKMGKMPKMGKMGKMPKKAKARGGALPGLGDISAGLAVANAALPVVSGIADAIGSLFGHTETTVERETAKVPELTDAQKEAFLAKLQGKGLKKMKKTRGGNVGGDLYSDDDGKRGMIESDTVVVPNKGGNVGGKLRKSRGAGMVGGSMPKKMNYIPKETNVMSSFYQFDTLPKSNYAPRSNMSKGGAFMMPDGRIIDPPTGQNPMMGGGLFDTLGSLMPLAFMI